MHPLRGSDVECADVDVREQLSLSAGDEFNTALAEAGFWDGGTAVSREVSASCEQTAGPSTPHSPAARAAAERQRGRSGRDDNVVEAQLKIKSRLKIKKPPQSSWRLSCCVHAARERRPRASTLLPASGGWAGCCRVRRVAASGGPTWRPESASHRPSSSAVRAFRPA